MSRYDDYIKNLLAALREHASRQAEKHIQHLEAVASEQLRQDSQR